MHPAQEPEQLPSASLWRQDTLPHAPGPLALADRRVAQRKLQF
jgi:hypothetical protein